MKLSLLAVLLLAGCATPITHESAGSMASYDLCRALYGNGRSGAERDAAAAELRSRGEDCSYYGDAIRSTAAISAANNAAMMSAGLAIIQANQPKQQVCTGQFIGTMWQEVCR